MSWAIVPAAGAGRRFGGDVPKQYEALMGQPMLGITLDALLGHPGIDGVMVALAVDDTHWPGWRERHGKPVLTCVGGGERAESVLAALQALPATVTDDDHVLVHDAARPCLDPDDLQRLLDAGRTHPVGAILGAPVRDTLKRVGSAERIFGTEPREGLWRAFTPQMFRRGGLTRALSAALGAGCAVTDEASAMERLGLKPLIVEGREDNLKVTTAADLALAEFVLSKRSRRNGPG